MVAHHEKRHRDDEVHIIDKQRRLVGELIDYEVFKNKKQYRKNDKSDCRNYQSPAEKAMIATLFVFEIRIVAHCRGVGAQGRQTRQQQSGISHDTSKANLLLSEIFRHHKEGGNEPHGNAEIIHYRAFNALSYYYSH